jgi:hypothetical protein
VAVTRQRSVLGSLYSDLRCFLRHSGEERTPQSRGCVPRYLSGSVRRRWIENACFRVLLNRARLRELSLVSLETQTGYLYLHLQDLNASGSIDSRKKETLLLYALLVVCKGAEVSLAASGRATRSRNHSRGERLMT